MEGDFGKNSLRYPTSKAKLDHSRSQSRGKMEDIRARQAKTTMQGKRELNDGDFEKMFGKDIDQYLEGSDFDLDEFDNNSQYSRGTGAAGSHAPIKLKSMEKMYLKRVESSQHNTANVTKYESIKSGSKTNATSGLALQTGGHTRQKSHKKPPAFREF